MVSRILFIMVPLFTPSVPLLPLGRNVGEFVPDFCIVLLSLLTDVGEKLVC